MKKKLLVGAILLMHLPALNAQVNHGYFLEFDGNDWVDIGDRDALNFGMEDFTISAWFYSRTQNRQQIIIRKGLDNRTFGEGRWVLKIHSNNVIKIVVDHVSNNFGTTFQPEGSTIVTDKQWHHVAAVFDRDQTLRVYLDGNLEILDDGLVNQPDSLYNRQEVYLGRDNAGDNPFFFDGFLDEIRIWNTARSQAMIQTTMNDTLGPEYYTSPDSGLIAYWRLDEGPDGEIAYDLSVNDNNGLVIGPKFTSIITGVDSHTFPQDLSYKLHQNYPNPFNPTTLIKYEIQRKSIVNMNIYNILGQKIKTLVSTDQTPGFYTKVWNGTNDNGKKVPSGTYFYTIMVNNGTETRVMTLIR